MPSVADLLRMLALEIRSQGWPLLDMAILLEAADVLARIDRASGSPEKPAF